MMDFQNLNAYWRAASYLTVGQIYLQDNPLLSGRDTLVFTGGIGERAAPARWEICQGLPHLGVRLDPRPRSVSVRRGE